MRTMKIVRCVLLSVFSFNPSMHNDEIRFAISVENNSTDNTISVLMGKPDGTFSPKVDYATGIRPVSMIVADFNGDGILAS